MKAPRLIDGQFWMVTKTFSILVDNYANLEKELDEEGLTPSELINAILAERYANTHSPSGSVAPV